MLVPVVDDAAWAAAGRTAVINAVSARPATECVSR